MKTKRNLVIIAIASVIVAAILLAYRPEPVAISVAEVTRGGLQVTVEEEGRTRVRERYVVSSPMPAFARRIDLDSGDAVAAGETLAVLEPTPAAALDPRSRAEAEARVDRTRAALDAEQSRLEAAEARYELARQEMDRVEPLLESGTISRREYDRTASELRQARADRSSAQHAVEVARQELRAAKAVLEYGNGESAPEELPVRSPIDGRVLKIHHKSQGTVQAGQPLLTVGDPGSLEIEVDVLSPEAVRIRPGMKVIFERWGGDAPLEGRVRVVEPSGFTKVSALGVEEQRVLVIADITSPFEEWKALGDAYRVEAVFVLWEDDDVLKAPSSALFRDRDQWSVFVVRDGTAHKVPVEVGHRGALEVEITDGIAAGDRVITHPDDTLNDGAPVEMLD